MLKVGDRVRLKAIPPWVGEAHEDLKALFAQCLGGMFTVHGIGTNTIPEGLTNDAELRIQEGKDDPQPESDHPTAIWVEPEYLEIVRSAVP